MAKLTKTNLDYFLRKSTIGTAKCIDDLASLMCECSIIHNTMSFHVYFLSCWATKVGTNWLKWFIFLPFTKVRKDALTFRKSKSSRTWHMKRSNNNGRLPSYAVVQPSIFLSNWCWTWKKWIMIIFFILSTFWRSCAIIHVSLWNFRCQFNRREIFFNICSTYVDRQEKPNIPMLPVIILVCHKFRMAFVWL